MSATGASNELGFKSRWKADLPQILDPSTQGNSSPAAKMSRTLNVIQRCSANSDKTQVLLEKADSQWTLRMRHSWGGVPSA